MIYYMKEWGDETVSLLSESGQILGYYCSIRDALDACGDIELVNLDGEPAPPFYDYPLSDYI